jgi:uncharacterized protein YceH (UPF0502 family)
MDKIRSTEATISNLPALPNGDLSARVADLEDQLARLRRLLELLAATVLEVLAD